MIWLSSDLRFQRFWVSIDVCLKWFWLSVELNFNWGGCQLIWDSSDSVVNWSEIPVSWLSTDVWFKWFWLSVDVRANGFGVRIIWKFKWVGCQLMCDSNDFGCELMWDSNDLDFELKFKWVGGQLIWDSIDLVVNRFEIQSLSARLPSKMKLWRSKNEAFLRDFLQNWSFEAQKRSFSTRLPSKMKLWRSKTKLFCETSFKIEALKLKNEAILRDFLQKWIFEDQKRSFFARLPSKMTYWPDTWPQNSNTF